jgi:4-hydroxybenzoate polyprenyltransferase
LGLILFMFSNAALFMLFYFEGWDWHKPLIIMFISLILMTLSLYGVNKVVNTSGGIV